MSFLSRIEKKTSVIPNVFLNQPLHPRSSTQGDIGLELEIEGVNLPEGPAVSAYTSKKSSAQWVVHRDGSLRGGVEYVFSEPAFIEELPGLLDHIFGELSKPGVTVRHSNRTSTHVHINVRGMKVSEMTSFILLWGLFEPAAIDFCGVLRKSNQFCLSSKDTNGWLPETWFEAIRSGEFAFSNEHKYNALNLGAFSRFGSFEFRCMAGAENPETVLGWVKFLLALREYAKTALPDEIAYAVSERSPEGILEDVCTRYDVPIYHALTDSEDFSERALENFREYQALSFCLPWSDLRKEIDKTFVKNPFRVR